MAALRSGALSFTSGFGSAFPVIGRTLFAELLPTLCVASPPRSSGGELCALTATAMFPPSNGSGASLPATSGLSLALESGSRSLVVPFAGTPLWNLGGLPRSDLGKLASGEGSSSGRPRIFAGFAAGAVAVGVGSYLLTQQLNESFVRDTAGFFKEFELLSVGAGLTYCKGLETKDESAITTKGNDGGGGVNGSPQPPPPPRGLSPLEKKLFLELLLELQHNLRRLLDGKEYDDVKMDLAKKNELIVLVVTDIEETRQLVEALLKEMQSRNNQHVIVSMLQKFSVDLASMQKEMASQNEEVKSWTTKKLDEYFGDDARKLLYGFVNLFRDVYEFVKGKYMFALGLAACISAKIYPKEGFNILVMLFEEARDHQRKRIARLQEQNRLQKEAKAKVVASQGLPAPPLQAP